jgi:hypothetical protein
MMTEKEYNYLTGKEKSHESFQYCRTFDLCSGLDLSGRPVLTGRGIRMMKAYQAEESKKLSRDYI